MVNFEKIDEQDFVFLDQPWTEAEKQAFSNFLKTRKEKKQITHKVSLRKNSKNYRSGAST